MVRIRCAPLTSRFTCVATISDKCHYELKLHDRPQPQSGGCASALNIESDTRLHTVMPTKAGTVDGCRCCD